MTENYIALFSASIALAGFMALFVFFIWQTLDNYINSYKSVLRRILERQKIHETTDPSMYLTIQSIGKDINKDKQYKDTIIASYSLSDKPKNAVSEIFSHIEQLIVLRQKVIFYGIIDITYWIGYAVLCLIGIWLWNNRCLYCVQYTLCIILFIIGISYTTCMLWMSLKNVGLGRYIKDSNI
jgi:hypothetical protein